MNILYIVPYAPTRIRVRPYSLIRQLARRGNRVILATVWENAAELEALRALEQEGVRVISQPLSRRRRAWNSLRALPTASPLQSFFSWQPDLARDIHALIQTERLDAIQVEHIRGSQYALHAQEARQHSDLNAQTPVIWDAVDCISHLFRQTAGRSRYWPGRLMSRFELSRTERMEAWLAGQFDRVLVTSETDKLELEKLAAARDRRSARPLITVVTNGVDHEYFHPAERSPQPDTIVFSGKMSYHANATAAEYLIEEVMPLVWQQRHQARLTIVGSRPSAHIRRLAAQHAGRITISGYVPDIRPYLWEACLAAAPVLYGAGIQNKVLEAMACARPVVVTSRARSPLGHEAEEACRVADTPPLFAQAILDLLDHPDLRARMGAAGRHYVTRRHDWNAITAQLEETYRESRRL